MNINIEEVRDILLISLNRKVTFKRTCISTFVLCSSRAILIPNSLVLGGLNLLPPLWPNVGGLEVFLTLKVAIGTNST